MQVSKFNIQSTQQQRQPAFGAKLNINCERGWNVGLNDIISQKFQQSLEKLVKTIGSDNDTVTINLETRMQDQAPSGLKLVDGWVDANINGVEIGKDGFKELDYLYNMNREGNIKDRKNPIYKQFTNYLNTLKAAINPKQRALISSKHANTEAGMNLAKAESLKADEELKLAQEKAKAASAKLVRVEKKQKMQSEILDMYSPEKIAKTIEDKEKAMKTEGDKLKALKATL